MGIGLYKVTYFKDAEVFEVLMPISDWLKRRAVRDKHAGSQATIRAAFVLFAARKYNGKVIDPAGLDCVEFERLRNATAGDQFKAFLHMSLAP